MKLSFVINNIVFENSVAPGSHSEIDFSQKAVLEQVQNELCAVIHLCFMTVSRTINALKQVESTY